MDEREKSAMVKLLLLSRQPQMLSFSPTDIDTFYLCQCSHQTLVPRNSFTNLFTYLHVVQWRIQGQWGRPPPICLSSGVFSLLHFFDRRPKEGGDGLSGPMVNTPVCLRTISVSRLFPYKKAYSSLCASAINYDGG